SCARAAGSWRSNSKRRVTTGLRKPSPARELRANLMSQAVKEQSRYADAFREFAEARTGEPSWLERLRAGAFGRFEEVGLPSTDVEDWKYTKVAPLACMAYSSPA